MILMPLAQYDFDPSEAAIPWKVLSASGYDIQFATPTGKPGTADLVMLTGTGLGIWKSILMARSDAVEAYHEMEASAEFQKPLGYRKLSAAEYDGLILPGGHAPGMKEYLESEDLMNLVSAFMQAGKPVGAICHGVLLAARSKGSDGKSVIFGKKVTCLLKSQELAAWNMTRLWMGNYYRTYPETTTQDEVVSFLESPQDFLSGKTPVFRDTPEKLSRGFVVRDGNLVTARWPGDVYSFAKGFAELL